MKLVIDWLEDFIEVPWSAEVLAERLPTLGTGVEGGSGNVLELEITPNRGDLLSHRGIARDLHAATGAALRVRQTRPMGGGRSDVVIETAEAALAPRYSAVTLHGIRVRPTNNQTIVARLKSSGMRPVNNIVDITNYVMLETGQPSHAFDSHKIHGGTMKIRLSKRGQTLTTLDGVERKLPEGVLIIEDADRVIDLAGIMGGENSAIDEKTSSVLLQAAIFAPLHIRRASKALRLTTEASYRYERSVDPEGTLPALARLVELLLEEAGGKLGGLTDMNRTVPGMAIVFDPSLVERVLGRSYPRDEIQDILTRLGCNLREQGDEYSVIPPSWRTDLALPEDLVEEIARIDGYKNIPAKSLPKQDARPSSDYLARESLKDSLISQGLSEVATYSLVGTSDLDQTKTLADEAVTIANPLAADLRYFRPSLLPGLLKAAAKNPTVDPLRIFEVGRVASKEHEKVQVGILLAGKGAAEISDVVKTLGLTPTRVPSSALNHYKVRKNDVFVCLGDWSAVKSKVAPKKDLLIPIRKAIKSLSKYPASSRDISFIVDEAARNDEIKAAISEVSPDVYLVEQFDEFTSPQIGTGKKSLAFHIHYQDPEKTMMTKEIKSLHGRVADLLRRRFKATIR